MPFQDNTEERWPGAERQVRELEEVETSDHEVCIKKMEKGSDFNKLSSKNLFYLEHTCSAAKSCLALCDPVDCSSVRLLCPWNFSSKNTRMGCHFLLQGLLLTQGSNPCLLHLFGVGTGGGGGGGSQLCSEPEIVFAYSLLNTGAQWGL